MVGVVRSNDPGERMLADPSSEMALMACGGDVQRLQRNLRGRGNYFRTGNAADKFVQIDDYVRMRLRSLLVKRKGRNLRAGEAHGWTRDWFWGWGLHWLMGTIRYSGTA